MVADPGTIPVEQKDSVEFKLYVLSDPGDIKTDPQTLRLPDMKLDASKLLVDYRAWIGGPCTLLNMTTGDPAYADIDKFCQAIKAAQHAVATTQSLEIKARLYDMLGLGQIILGNIPESATNLMKAAQTWGALDRVWQVSVSLHNLAVAASWGDDQKTATVLLMQVQELYAQVKDEPGQMITWANLGHLSNNSAMLKEAHQYFTRNELPQSAVTAIWLSQIKEQP